ncbi:MAG TPA: transcriptional regulator [Rhizobium sp.]|nr:transcriptional regulator [Rhizobium sp.]
MTTNLALADQASMFDEAKAQAFAGTMIGALNRAALVLMTSIGHRTGLFDTLAEAPSTTAATLAENAGLSERYVREWLSVLATSGVVDYDPTSATFTLPAEHAAFLTRSTKLKNIAVIAQFLGVSFEVEDEIIQRFRDGKGLHYHHYGRFHEVMAESSQATVVKPLIDHILPLVPGTIGKLEKGIDVADIGCGQGLALLKLAETFPNSRFTGYDLCGDAFRQTDRTRAEKGLANLKFVEKDLSAVDDLGHFDLVFAFDAIHDQRDPQGLLKAIRRSLSDGGALLMQEVGGSSYLERNAQVPLAPFLYMMSTMHCTPVSLGQGGAGLGTMWGVEMAQDMLRNAGFSTIDIARLPHDIVNAYFVARP